VPCSQQIWGNLYNPAAVLEPVAAPYAVPVTTPAILAPTSGAVLVPEAPPSGAVVVPAEPTSGAVLPVAPAVPIAAAPVVTPPGGTPGQALNPFAVPVPALTAGALSRSYSDWGPMCTDFGFGGVVLWVRLHTAREASI